MSAAVASNVLHIPIGVPRAACVVGAVVGAVVGSSGLTVSARHNEPINSRSGAYRMPESSPMVLIERKQNACGQVWKRADTMLDQLALYHGRLARVFIQHGRDGR